MPTRKVEVCTKSGESIVLDVEQETPFGFNPGDIVHFTKSLRNGKVALIRGMSDGMIWFSVHPSVEEAAKPSAIKVPVDTVSCRGKEELIRQYGWMKDDKTNELASADHNESTNSHVGKLTI